MKKLFLIMFAVLTVTFVQSQTVASLTPDTVGTLAGSATGTVHTFTSPKITGDYKAWSVEVYCTTTGTHAADSTHAQIYGSMDGTNYFPLTYALMGVPRLVGAAFAASTFSYFQGVAGALTTGTKLSSAGAGAGGWTWNVLTPMPYKYIAVKITQYKALSVLTVNACKLHLVK